MKIESSEFEHGRVYFKQFGAERVKVIVMKNIFVYKVDWGIIIEYG